MTLLHDVQMAHFDQSLVIQLRCENELIKSALKSYEVKCSIKL